MSTLAWALAALLAAGFGVQALGLVVVIVQLLRMALPRPECVSEDLATPLGAAQQATLDELRQLGFEMVSRHRARVGASLRPAAWLRHVHEPAFAEVTFAASARHGYPVAFHSIDQAGALLTTCNRADWLLALWGPDPALVDAYAETLDAQWQAHRARLAKALPVDAGETRERVFATAVARFDLAASAGRIVRHGDTWHASLRSAVAVALALRRVQRRMAKPFRCAATTGEHQAAFLVQCLREDEARRRAQAGERRVMGWLLLGSALASLLLWSLVFDPLQALTVLAVIAVHEAGHALAMRALGWKDVNVFFVPFVGAMVTGQTRSVAAWKQVVVLLAGPLPGLLAGAAMIGLAWRQPGLSAWQAPGLMAVGINLFNLLPLTPLDGGRLVELALFARWPRLRLGFMVGSTTLLAVLAVATESLALGAVTLVLAWALLSQWRIATLERAWDPTLPREHRLLQLARKAQQRFAALGPAQQMALLRAVLHSRLVRAPRWWESVLALVPLALVWLLPLALVANLGVGSGSVGPDARSPAQQAFDQAWAEAEAEDGDDASGLDTLTSSATGLAAGDPRQLDLQVRQGRRLPTVERRRQMATLLAGGRDGLVWNRDNLLRAELQASIDETRKRPAAYREAALRAALAWADAAAPGMWPATLEARLRLAEAIDQSGKTQDARELLDRLQQQATAAAAAGSDTLALREVLRARAWFELSQGQAQAALAMLNRSPFAGEARQGLGPLALEYAWSVLLAGQTENVLPTMRAAAASPRLQGLLPTLLGTERSAGGWLHPMDMAYALHRSGKADEARALVASLHPGRCRLARADNSGDLPAAPWQQERQRLLHEVARELCPG